VATIYTYSVSSGLGLRPATTAYVSPIQLSVSSRLSFHPTATAVHLRTIVCNVSAGLGLSPVLTLQAIRIYQLSVSSGLGLQPVPVLVRNALYSFTVSSGLGLRPSASLVANHVYTLSVGTGLGLGPAIPALTANALHSLSVSTGLGLRPAATTNLVKILTVSAGLSLSPSALAPVTRSFSVSTGLRLQATALAPRTITVSVSSGLGLRQISSQAGAGLYGVSVSVGLGLHPTLTLVHGSGVSVSSGFALTPSVTCIVTAAAVGPGTPLLSGLSGSYPFTYAGTPAGLVLAANGIDPVVCYDPLTGQADMAGLVAPATAPVLGSSGTGTITGLRYAFARFLDADGNPSNLSPAGGPISCGRDQLLDGITLNATTGLVTIQSRNHGLTTNSSVVLQGISQLPLNGQRSVTVTSPDHFTLQGVTLTQGQWLGAGSFVRGVASLTYTAIPVPSPQGRTVSVQLLRNLEGSGDVFYVDVTVPVGTTTASSTRSDEDLAQQEAVVIRTPEGTPLALRYSPPPSNRPYIVNYLGRIFAAGDMTYYAGCISVITGSRTVQGIGTQWTASIVGRRLFVKGASRSYGIAALDVENQVMTLEQPYTGISRPFTSYLIRSSPADRKMIQWSEVDNPAAWPPWNALAIPEDNDEITGLFVRGTYLFIAEQRHLWRFQFTGDPATGGHLFLAAERGVFNQRLIAQTDVGAFLLDESGIYTFDGSNPEPVSELVQVIFHDDNLAPTYQIDWTADTTLWHASVEPVRTTVRWFLNLKGIEGLTCCLAYDYRLKHWWWEQYPVSITSSCTGILKETEHAGIPAGRRRALVGADARGVLVLGEGALDFVDSSGGVLRGSVTAATSVSITDTAAAFSGALAGAPLTIVSGTGAGQTRIISSVSGSTLQVVQSWDVTPDITSIYQVGGISWQWRSGWWDAELQEQNTVRDLTLSFEPLSAPTQLAVQLLRDHALEAEPWAADTRQDDVSTYAGRPEIWFELSVPGPLPGWRIFRQADHGEEYAYDDRFVQVFMSGVTNDEVVRLYRLSLRAADQEGL
jgi:hypothetical protein